jgi:hypothetical protein
VTVRRTFLLLKGSRKAHATHHPNLNHLHWLQHWCIWHHDSQFSPLTQAPTCSNYLPLEFTILSQKLKQADYQTHFIGKKQRKKHQKKEKKKTPFVYDEVGIGSVRARHALRRQLWRPSELRVWLTWASVRET